jgi:hypothetical protein
MGANRMTSDTQIAQWITWTAKVWDKSLRRSVVSVVIAMVVLGGCATRVPPALVMEPGASLTGYKELEIASVVNDTGQKIDFDFVGAFSGYLKGALAAKGYHVTDDNAALDDALIVKCSFLTYEPGNAVERGFGAGATEAIVQTTIIDGKSGKPVAYMVTTKRVGAGTLGFPLLINPLSAIIESAATAGAYKSVLEYVANDVTIAIDNKIQGLNRIARI